MHAVRHARWHWFFNWSRYFKTKISSMSNNAAEVCTWGSLQTLCCRWNVFSIVTFEKELKCEAVQWIWKKYLSCSTLVEENWEICSLYVLIPIYLFIFPLISGEYNQYVFKEWSSRRRWIERKNAKKTNIISGTSEPELIFYGRHSGIIGLSKCEIFDKRFEHENSDFGYDKVCWFFICKKKVCWF